MAWCDAHIHLTECSFPPDFQEAYYCVTSVHENGWPGNLQFPSRFPWFRHSPSLSYGSRKTTLSATPIGATFLSFGIHPQMKAHGLYDASLKDTLINLAQNKELTAIGECGFDFFTPEFKSTADWQDEVFDFQIKLAAEYNLPLVIHLRKAIHKVFEYKKELKALPSVIFHSFPGTYNEAQSILNHQINAFFSFGKPLLNGKKSALECAEKLSSDRLLMETDAPYQTLKGEKETLPVDIIKVYRQCASLRNADLQDFKNQIESNFFKAYRLLR